MTTPNEILELANNQTKAVRFAILVATDDILPRPVMSVLENAVWSLSDDWFLRHHLIAKRTANKAIQIIREYVSKNYR